MAPKKGLKFSYAPDTSPFSNCRKPSSLCARLVVVGSAPFRTVLRTVLQFFDREDIQSIKRKAIDGHGKEGKATEDTKLAIDRGDGDDNSSV